MALLNETQIVLIKIYFIFFFKFNYYQHRTTSCFQVVIGGLFN